MRGGREKLRRTSRGRAQKRVVGYYFGEKNSSTRRNPEGVGVGGEWCKKWAKNLKTPRGDFQPLTKENMQRNLPRRK